MRTAAGPWISVKDRLPESALPGDGRLALVRVNGDYGPRGASKLRVFRRTSLAQWVGHGWRTIENTTEGISIFLSEREVTHWAEIDLNDLDEPQIGTEVELSDEERTYRLKKYGAP